jgi:hypothetical protein
MKTINNVTLYACDHCGKRFQTKYAHDYHEAHKCRKNPNNQHKCFEGNLDCQHLETIKDEYDINEEGFQLYCKRFYCKAINRQMYTYRLSDRHYIKPNIEGVRMPTQCELYEKREQL